MFGFKKKIQLADLPVSETAFSMEDLFVIMGGMDVGGLICDPHGFPWTGVEEMGMADGWRRDVVNRYGAVGKVDGSGEPLGDLAEIAYPFSRPSLAIKVFANEPPARQLEVSVADGRASVARVAKGRGKLFNIAGLGERENWDAAFERSAGLENSLVRAEESWHCDFLLGPGEDGLGKLIATGDVEGIRALGDAKGFDPERIVRVVERMGASDLDGSVRATTSDWRGCELRTVADGYRIPVPEKGDPRVKRAWIFPSLGCAFSENSAPRKGLPANWRDRPEYRLASRFFSFDFIAEGTILDYLMDVYDCPAELDGIPSGQPSRPR